VVVVVVVVLLMVVLFVVLVLLVVLIAQKPEGMCSCCQQCISALAGPTGSLFKLALCLACLSIIGACTCSAWELPQLGSQRQKRGCRVLDWCEIPQWCG
jgi:hypothetical protein